MLIINFIVWSVDIYDVFIAENFTYKFTLLLTVLGAMTPICWIFIVSITYKLTRKYKIHQLPIRTYLLITILDILGACISSYFFYIQAITDSNISIYLVIFLSAISVWTTLLIILQWPNNVYYKDISNFIPWIGKYNQSSNSKCGIYFEKSYPYRVSDN